MYLISACLAGIPCRYNGTSVHKPEFSELVNSGKAIAACPEVLGGLPIPRPPCEIRIENRQTKVIGRDGYEYTQAFVLGAEKTLRICRRYRITTAILKSMSPSCGCGRIYDGSFSGTIRTGKGVTAELLTANRIVVFTEENWKEESGSETG
ncbi:DUF523 domain-containing protein [Breznakiella homolactica]|uniref:DUF523 domain-containing protein n=1 Tax=Breznakiella homolactica TaxID=2798577 RepID=A0A7T8BA48_9SPIR|nr:DUF523 domain-containing protein [Breznakiella homolactica]QQO10294.1 DUF523 domain-containing protein [Breznakiella homolactica]